MEKVIENLRKNNMEPYFVQSKEEVLPLIEKLMKPGQTVAVGGSVSLNETGVIAYLRGGKYHFLDRFAPELSREEVTNIFRQSFLADVYLSSANAITEKGEIYNVDGNANRVAAILYGPESVILIAGKNKIVPDLKAAVQRVKQIASPLNCKRLGCATYCAEKGECVSLQQDAPDMCDGCASDARICCSYTVLARQRQKGRIKVILVNEDLGY